MSLRSTVAGLSLCAAAALSLSSSVQYTHQPAPYTNAWAHVRGANYVPSYAANSAQIWADYDKAVVVREVEYAHKLGLNTLRVFLSILVWCDDPDQFTANMEHLLDAAAAKQIQLLFVLFDDDFVDPSALAAPPRQFRTSAELRAEMSRWVQTGVYRNTSAWFASPGRAVLAADARLTPRWAVAGAYLDSMTKVFRSRSEDLVGIDIMNEPNRCDTERPCDWSGGLRGFVEWALTFTQSRTGGVPSTIDGADGQAVTRASLPDYLTANESGVTYHGYWHYDHMNWCTGNESEVTRWWTLRAAQYLAIARNLSKPVAITEFGAPECYCASATGIMAGGLGWILWELISDHGTQFGKWGLVFANGSSAVTPSVMDCIKRLTQH